MHEDINSRMINGKPTFVDNDNTVYDKMYETENKTILNQNSSFVADNNIVYNEIERTYKNKTSINRNKPLILYNDINNSILDKITYNKIINSDFSFTAHNNIFIKSKVSLAYQITLMNEFPDLY